MASINRLDMVEAKPFPPSQPSDLGQRPDPRRVFRFGSYYFIPLTVADKNKDRRFVNGGQALLLALVAIFGAIAYSPQRLVHAYRLARVNASGPGVDGMTFARIGEKGLEAWLAGSRMEPVAKTYRPDPVPGVSPSKKSVQRLKTGIGDLLVPSNIDPWPEVYDKLNMSLRGWSNYFGCGSRSKAYQTGGWPWAQSYRAHPRLYHARHWLMRNYVVVASRRTRVVLWGFPLDR